MTKEEAQKEAACLGWQIDALMKKRQMDMALEIKQRVKEKLKIFEECEYD